MGLESSPRSVTSAQLNCCRSVGTRGCGELMWAGGERRARCQRVTRHDTYPSLPSPSSTGVCIIILLHFGISGRMSIELQYRFLAAQILNRHPYNKAEPKAVYGALVLSKKLPSLLPHANPLLLRLTSLARKDRCSPRKFPQKAHIRERTGREKEKEETGTYLPYLSCMMMAVRMKPLYGSLLDGAGGGCGRAAKR